MSILGWIVIIPLGLLCLFVLGVCLSRRDDECDVSAQTISRPVRQQRGRETTPSLENVGHGHGVSQAKETSLDRSRLTDAGMKHLWVALITKFRTGIAGIEKPAT
jgi:hypothetical protein